MDSISPEARRRNMQMIRSKGTKPEIVVRCICKKIGVIHSSNSSSLYGKPDIIFRKIKCAIFVHGCFWHRHECPAGIRVPKSNIIYWDEKFKRNIIRDKKVLRTLRKEGWRALVIWECELKKPGLIEKRISSFLNQTGKFKLRKKKIS